MHQRIEHRLPSPALRCARVMPHGVVFRATDADGDLGMDFIPSGEVEKFFGSPDSWVAHMLLWRCAKCIGMVEGN